MGSAGSIALISDLHVRGEEAAVQAGSDYGTLHRLIGTIADEPSVRCVIVAGDITDTGSESDWAAAAQLLSRLSAAGKQVVCVPGNHDKHFARFESSARTWYLGNLIPGWSTDPSSYSYSSAHVAQALTKCSGMSYSVNFPALFVLPESGIQVLVLDSNEREVGGLATNAVGFVSPEQFARAREVMSSTSSSLPLIIALHHHVVGSPYSYGSILAFLSAQFLICVNAGEVLRFAEECQAIAIVHGHTHMPFAYLHEYQRSRRDGQSTGPSTMVVVSCGSATYGAGGLFADSVVGQSCFSLALEPDPTKPVRLALHK